MQVALRSKNIYGPYEQKVIDLLIQPKELIMVFTRVH